MKPNIIILCTILVIILLSSFANAQTSAIYITSEDNIAFRLYIDGEKMNNFYEKEIKVKEIKAGKHKLTISFESDTIADVNIYVLLPQGMKENYVVKRKSKNRRNLDKLGRKFQHSLLKNKEIVTVEAVDYYTLSFVSVEILREEDFDKVSIPPINPTLPDTITKNQFIVNPKNNEPEIELPQDTATESYNETGNYVARKGCFYPMNEYDYLEVYAELKTIKNEKLLMEKSMDRISNNCMFTQQVSKIINLQNTEKMKLELAKYAYKHTFDIENYASLAECFTIEKIIKEFLQFVDNNSPAK